MMVKRVMFTNFAKYRSAFQSRKKADVSIRSNMFFLVFPWFSYGFPMVFLWFSPWFSYGFPMVFPCFPLGFLPGFAPPWHRGVVVQERAAGLERQREDQRLVTGGRRRELGKMSIGFWWIYNILIYIYIHIIYMYIIYYYIYILYI